MQASTSMDAPVQAPQPLQSATDPVATATVVAPVAPILSTGDWVLTLIVLSIPLLNIPVMLYWALSSSGNPNRRNFCKAFLLVMLLGLVLAFLLGGLIAGAQI
ncbi:MAG: hypothetical protein Q4E06_12835 [Lautropia sp.]|nr:hypothetical protein [Lautropia sp.]